MIFHSPAMLWLLLLLPVLVWWLFIKRRAVGVKFGSTRIISSIRGTPRLRARWILPVLRIAAIGLMILGLARPREGLKHTTTETQGIAIQMLIDRSGSMQAMDFQLNDRPVDRLSAVKDAASRFILGDDQLEGRGTDLIGLISFARFADGISPLTLDHPYLIGKLNQTQIARDRSEDGTAIGDAIGLAIERLQPLEERHRSNRSDPVKSKIIILLTDGENNAGQIDPVPAAELAATMGVKIYTIGVGTKGRAPVPVTNPFTGRKTMQWVRVNIDEAMLKRIAEMTAGRYFRATDTQSLESIYQEIDHLEKTRIEEKHYVDYREFAIESIHTAGWTLPPLLWSAFILLAAQSVLAYTVFRQIP